MEIFILLGISIIGGIIIAALSLLFNTIIGGFGKWIPTILGFVISILIIFYIRANPGGWEQLGYGIIAMILFMSTIIGGTITAIFIKKGQ